MHNNWYFIFKFICISHIEQWTDYRIDDIPMYGLSLLIYINVVTWRTTLQFTTRKQTTSNQLNTLTSRTCTSSQIYSTLVHLDNYLKAMRSNTKERREKVTIYLTKGVYTLLHWCICNANNWDSIVSFQCWNFNFGNLASNRRVLVFDVFRKCQTVFLDRLSLKCTAATILESLSSFV